MKHKDGFTRLQGIRAEDRDHPRVDDNYYQRPDGWLSKKRVAEVKERSGVL